uniref:Uncharacterized protein n=1 Tax=Nothoprocta perdicaria TaxID=30464 RepID=A0A8C6ZA36_NOTPE
SHFSPSGILSSLRLVGAETEVIEFLLYKTVHGQTIFEHIENDKPQIGDILLFPLLLDDPTLQMIYVHGAVYCGEGEVIHFQSKSVASWLLLQYPICVTSPS